MIDSPCEKCIHYRKRKDGPYDYCFRLKDILPNILYLGIDCPTYEEVPPYIKRWKKKLEKMGL